VSTSAAAIDRAYPGALTRAESIAIPNTQQNTKG
jgi:hypothetical protein